jgi:hypothetical protein
LLKITHRWVLKIHTTIIQTEETSDLERKNDMRFYRNTITGFNGSLVIPWDGHMKLAGRIAGREKALIKITLLILIDNTVTYLYSTFTKHTPYTLGEESCPNPSLKLSSLNPFRINSAFLKKIV